MPEEGTQKHYTYADYLEWDDDLLCEAFDGVIVDMAPAPTPQHQAIQVELAVEFGSFLRGQACQVFSAPIDVCLFATPETANEDVQNWVQPDLLVVCDRNKIQEKRIIGAPDLVIEILSPATARTDRLIKYSKYEQAGVKEYWIVDPIYETVEVFLREGNTFNRIDLFTKTDVVAISIFDDFEIKLSDIFRT